MIQLTRFSLKRAAVIVLATLLLSLLGGYSASRLNVDLLPDIEFPVVSIVTIYPGASPDDVNTGVTVPIEGVLSGTTGLQSLTSTSSEGVGVTVAQYDFGTDLDDVERTITNGLGALNLPQGVVAPQINRFNFNNFPVLTLGLLGDADPSELEALASGRIVPELRGLPGVARVDVTGGAQRQVRLTIDPQKLAASGVTLTQVTGALQGNNFILPAGTVVEGAQSIPVRAGTQFASVEEIQNLVVGVKGVPAAAGAAGGPPAGVGGGATGGPPAGVAGGATAPPAASGAPASAAPGAAPELVRLSDVAAVELTNAPNATISRTNGKPSIGIQIVKAQGANTIDVADGVKAKIEELKGAGALPPNVEIATVEDQSIAIKESITGLIKEGLIGALFAVIVIFIFLRNLRLTLVAAVSIPTSVLASFILMSLAGLSLNIFTLGALAIAIGRVVDDSIVVLENIARRYGQGDALGTAILEGTREVAGAITASTLTTAAVFMPIGLVGGITSQFFLPFALTVVFALITSLIVSLTIIPVFAKLFIGRRSSFTDEREGRLERFYLRSLRWTLGHRALSLVLAVILLVASFGLTPFIGTAFLPASGQKLIRIAATAPAGSSQATTDALAKSLEAEVARGANLETYATTVGANARELAFGAGGTTNVSISALYNESADVEAESDRLRAATRGLPNLDNINIEVVQNGPPGQNQLQVIVTGNDFAQVSAASERVLAATSGVAGLNNIKSDLVAAKPEISVTVDPNKAAARGLNGVAVAGQVRSLIAGQSVTQVALPSGRVEVYALFATGQEQAAVAQLENLTVFGATGPVRVGDVATVARVNGPTQILRVDRERAVTITATVTGDNLGAVTSDTQAAIDGLGLPAGVNATVGGAAEAQNETFAALGVALLVAIVLVYIVMVGTFGNLRDPFVILFSLPLAIIGAIVALFVTQRALGLPALIGLLLLIGIVVTNAIVLLDRVKQQREKGQPYREALLEAGRTRLRPILMTAFATILALVPLALGLNEGAIVAAELATVVIGGLFTSTLLTLLIVPAVYSLFEDAVERINRRRGRGDDDASSESDDTGNSVRQDEAMSSQEVVVAAR